MSGSKLYNCISMTNYRAYFSCHSMNLRMLDCSSVHDVRFVMKIYKMNVRFLEKKDEIS